MKHLDQTSFPNRAVKTFSVAIFHSISQLETQFGHSHLPNNGSAAAVAYAAVAVVPASVDAAIAV